jgi:hypothetical protein
VSLNFLADFLPEFNFADFFSLSQRFSFVKTKSITYVLNELFSSLKLTNLGEIRKADGMELGTLYFSTIKKYANGA